MAEGSGLAKHPEYYGHRIQPGMKLPGDVRKLRDIKIYEIPTWFMKRDWSPLGMYFSVKRFRNRLQTKYFFVKGPGANLLAICAVWMGIASYAMAHNGLKGERLRKYH